MVVSVIADRKANPGEYRDTLNTMLNGKDPKTGEGLSDESIRFNASPQTLM
jgi:cytochrome P450 / NADPH-cytochrome P450 reductase